MDKNIKKNNLIEFYKKYIYLEELNSIKIDPSKAHLISEPLFINFSQLNEDHQNNLILKLEDSQKSEINKKFPIQLNKSNNDENRIYMFFPLLKVVEKTKTNSKEFIYPLFAIDITDYKGDHNSIPLEVISSSNYIPIFNTFNKFLGIEEDFFSENVSISYLLNNLMKTKFTSAKNILEYFLKYLNSHTKGATLFYKFGVISKLEINNLSKNLKYELDIIHSSKIEDMPLIEDYLFKKHDYKKDNSFIEDNKNIWLGSFNDFPLSKGQARVLQSIKENNIVSVMGAPGTGKTNLFLSVIASQIVERALSNIYQTKDINNLMFITSTSNKAVNNVIEDFKEIFKNRNDFYFVGGKRENIDESKNRILKYVEELEDDLFFDKDLFFSVENEIKEIVLKIKTFQEVFIKKEFLEIEMKELQKKEFLYKSINDEIKKVKKLEIDIEVFKKKISEILKKEEEIEDRKKTYKNKKEIIDYIYKNLKNQFKFNSSFLKDKDLNDLFKSPFLNELVSTGEKLLSINPFFSLLEFIYKKKDKALKVFIEQNKTYTEYMDIEITLNNIFLLADLSERLIHYYNNELSDIDLRDLKTEELLDKELDSFFKEKIGLIKKEKETKNKIGEIKRKEKESILMKEHIDNQKQLIKEYELYLFEFKDLLSKNKSFTNFFREHFYKDNKRLYELSTIYLREKAINEKTKVVYYLRLWIELLDDKKTREEKKFIDFEEFYETISLVYPVITSTLAGISNNLKTELYNKKKNKPFALCLVDESGMISIPTLLPALFRSNKAIVVGDPKQLEPIVGLSENNRNELASSMNKDDFILYSPTSSTAYHRAAFCSSGEYTDIGNGILLDEHRRCQPDIANLFKEIAGYKKLKIETKPLTEEELEKLKKMNFKNLNFFNVKGKQGKYENTNISEIEKIKDILLMMDKAGVDIKKEVGIITPFSNQETLLLEFFSKKLDHHFGNEKIGTVHKFQGAEFNYIIFSSVIFGPYNKASFINLKPNLLNVAISRAKHSFIQVGEEETLRKAGGYLGIMMKHFDISGNKF